MNTNNYNRDAALFLLSMKRWQLCWSNAKHENDMHDGGAVGVEDDSILETLRAQLAAEKFGKHAVSGEVTP